MGLGKVEEGKSSAAGNSLHPDLEDGIVAGRGFIFLTPSASPPLSSPLHPPPSTCSVSHLSLKTARGSHSLPPPPLAPVPLPLPTPATTPPARGGTLSYPHRLGVHSITVEGPDEPLCLPGQEHAGEGGLLSLHPLTNLSQAQS